MRLTRHFGQEPASVPAARRFAMQAMERVPPTVADAVELMVSELATNCIRHAGRAFDLTITSGKREIRVEATDDGGGEPAMRSPSNSDPFGRGLRIVDALSNDWGVLPVTPEGKTVWFTVKLTEAA